MSYLKPFFALAASCFCLHLTLCFVLLHSGCAPDGKKKSAYHYRPVHHPQATSVFPFWGIDSAYTAMLIKKGYYRPTQTCPDSVVILPPKPINPLTQDFALLTATPNRYGRLSQLCAYLYTTLPTFYLDTFDNYLFDYNITPQNIEEKLMEAKQARYATLCRGHVAFTKVLWQKLYDTNHAVIQEAELYITHPDSFPHTVSLFYFPQKTDTLAVVLDATYGYLFPLKNDSSLYTLSQLRQANDHDFSAQHHLHYLPDSTLHQKRFLTYQTWPCNFGKYHTRIYRHTPPGALRPIELLEPEHIELLNLPRFSMAKYKLLLLLQLARLH